MNFYYICWHVNKHIYIYVHWNHITSEFIKCISRNQNANYCFKNRNVFFIQTLWINLNNCRKNVVIVYDIVTENSLQIPAKRALQHYTTGDRPIKGSHCKIMSVITCRYLINKLQTNIPFLINSIGLHCNAFINNN